MSPWENSPLLSFVTAVLDGRRVMRQNSLLWVLAVSAEQQRPLGPMLAALARDESSYHWSNKLEALVRRLNAGVPLPDALQQVPGLLPPNVVLAIRVGAETGTLAETLKQAAKEFSEKQEQANFTWQGTFLYLAAVMFALFSVAGFVMYYIIPKFKKIFEDFGVELPELTMWVVSVSDAFAKYYWLIVLACGAILVWLAWRSRYGASAGPMRRLLFSSARGEAPVVLRILAVVVDAGRPVAGALSTMARHHDSASVRNRLLYVRNEVERGGDVWCELAEVGLLRTSEGRILDAAQRAGNLPWALQEVATSIERDIDYRVMLVLEILRPVFLLMMAAVVGIFVIGLFMPLLKLINDLS